MNKPMYEIGSRFRGWKVVKIEARDSIYIYRLQHDNGCGWRIEESGLTTWINKVTA